MSGPFEDSGLWRRVAEEGRLLVFERVGGERDPRAREIRLCGVFDSSKQLATSLHVLHLSQLDGALHVSGADGRVVLYFRRGVYLSGRSENPRDRLGEILVRAGKATIEDVDACTKEGSDQGALGNALVRRGVMTTQEVYDGLRTQAEAILDRAVALGSGTFHLVAPLDMTEVPAMLHIDTQSALMEALRRFDELKAKGQAAQSGLRRPTPVPAEQLPVGGAEAIVDTYNEALRRLFGALGSEVRARLRREAVGFVHNDSVPYHALFRDVEVDREGRLDRDRILENLAGMGDEAVTALQAGLSELLFFVLFAAGDEVDDNAQSGLHRDVSEAMRGLPVAEAVKGLRGKE